MTRTEPQTVVISRLLLAFKTLLMTMLVGAAAFAVLTAPRSVSLLSRPIAGLILFEYLLCVTGLVLTFRGRHLLRRYWIFTSVSDLAVTTVLVVLTGGVYSLYAVLYLIALMNAAVILDPWWTGTVWITSLLLYIGIVVASLEGPGPGSAHLAMRGALYISALSTVGFLSLTLVRRLTETEERAREGERRLSRLEVNHKYVLEAIRDPVLIVDRDGTVVGTNGSGKSFFGERIVGSSIHDAIQWLDLDSDEVQTGTVRARGGERHVEVVGSPYETGSPGGRVILVRDRTELVEMEREMERKERMAAIGRLASTVAHELRNPLASIRGALELLFVVEEPERSRLREIVFGEIDRLDSLVGDLLAYAREKPLSMAVHDLHELIEEMVFLLLQDRAWQGREISMDGSAQAWVDPSAFRQVVLNLVKNALEADPSASVHISLKEEDGTTVVEISDDGPGIPSDMRESVFEPFFTTKEKGSGLGLAVAKRLTERMGGTLQLVDAPKGTVWRLTLRRHAPSTETEAIPEGA